MLTKDKLARLNALANKAKAEGLSLSEQKEQKELRQEYLGNVRSSFKNQFKSMTVMDREGNDVTPEKVKQLRDEK
ncbi:MULTISPECIES: DUF896 domain-containing protein [Terribacillus]|jgi:uncharacterized protein YnzC (UPF0291/DUF896 family)|uniref:UPF0291 protein GZ22_07375 n=1 Tax=Terribacillus saccharophilus TaxID=361277 RepID=A0A075LII7_9BACI|nr:MULTISPECIES: DUF896 domain-containing protein [Terribacillus]AIF66470.1 hypothetical protein GZ22_07375 [Terribacillus goriensis]MCM3224826.1 DUF896 domain-containing protein [Terribacillus saccharophilus]MEC0283254.1 DUF896 domain-containing protein [Terribacillus saccharophilus]MEC0290210.1 DUF896 domain-containing protein [Terribacillus saccharophilus]SEM69630.1 Uncharacterized protein YnzC, UPF0291/DUF896 family [Terribacillus saccharophilus]